MAIYKVSQPIITNGLALNLDLINTKSYSGTGSIINDMSASQNNGTLINSPTFTNEFGGGLVFDGTNKWINLGTNNTHVFSGGYSISIWLKNTTTANNEFIILNGVGTLNGGFLNYGLRKLSNVYYWYLSDGTTLYILTSNSNINTNITNIVLNMEVSGNTTIYLNGKADATVGSFYSTYSGSQNALAVSGIANGGGSSFLSGNFYQLSMYNRSLTLNEINQNFNAMRGRFGI